MSPKSQWYSVALNKRTNVLKFCARSQLCVYTTCTRECILTPMTMSMRFEGPHGRICQNVSKIGMQNSKWLECNGNSKFPIGSKSMRVKGAGQTLKTQNYRVKSYQNKATMLLLGFCAVVSANENKTWARLCKLSTVQSTATLNSFFITVELLWNLLIFYCFCSIVKPYSDFKCIWAH